MSIRPSEFVIRAVLAMGALAHSVRQRGLAVAVGCFVGWFVATVSGAIAYAWIELQGVSTETEGAMLAASAWVYSLISLGGVMGHRLSRKE